MEGNKIKSTLITGKVGGGRTTLALRLVYDYLRNNKKDKILIITNSSMLSILNKMMVFDKNNQDRVLTKEFRDNIEIKDSNIHINDIEKYSLILIDKEDEGKEIYANILNNHVISNVILVLGEGLPGTELEEQKIKVKPTNVVIIKNSVLVTSEESTNEYVYLMNIEELDLETLNTSNKEYQLVIKR